MFVELEVNKLKRLGKFKWFLSKYNEPIKTGNNRWLTSALLHVWALRLSVVGCEFNW